MKRWAQSAPKIHGREPDSLNESTPLYYAWYISCALSETVILVAVRDRLKETYARVTALFERYEKGIGKNGKHNDILNNTMPKSIHSEPMPLRQ